MILTKENIIEEVKFVPALDEFQVNPHSIDLRLKEAVWIDPGQTVMCQSMEAVTLPGNVMAVVFPRSSTNRRGCNVHMTGVVDANYSGQLIIPITNCGSLPVNFMKGERVASLIFHRLEKQATLRLSKYHGTDGTYKPDKGAEAQLLATGDIDGLKAKYAL